MRATRSYHIVAVTLLVLGLAAGGVSWAVHGTVFWVVTGLSVALIVAGLAVASRAADMERRQRREGE